MGDITKMVVSALIGLVLGGSGIGLLFKFWVESLFKKYTNKKEEQILEEKKRAEEYEALKDAVVRLLYSWLKNAAEKYARRGWISPDEMREFEKWYNLYVALGGNGAGKKLHDDMVELDSWQK